MSKYQTSVRPHRGLPTLFVNDEPIFLSSTYPKGELPTPGGVAIAHPIASRIACIRVAPQLAQDEEVDFRTACSFIDAHLNENPALLIILRTVIRAPAWWLNEHPEEELTFDQSVRHLPGYEDYRDASIGSELWLERLTGIYGRLVARLHQRYDGQIIAYQFGGGSQGEYNPLGACTNDSRWLCGDFSPAAVRYFRRWLKEKYGSDEALQTAWSRPEVTLDTAEIPDRVERLRTEWFTFRSPLHAHTADYYQSYAERVEDTVISLCSAVRRATEGKSIAGSHLGGYLDAGFHAYLHHQTAASALQRALEHPDVALFTTPSSYVARGPGGDSTPMVPLGSIQLHGKLRLQDQDTLTSIAFPPATRTHEEEILYFGFYEMPRHIPETLQLLRRDMGQMLIRGIGCWWHPLKPGVYNHPELAGAIARFQELGAESLNAPRGLDAQLAIISDPQSNFHQQMANRLLYPMLYHQRQHHWSRTGTGWEAFIHPDLGSPRMKDYPVYLFLNTFYLTNDEIATIEAKVKRNGAVVIWTYAPGIQSPAGFDLDRVERLTGFRLKAEPIEALPRITVTNYDHPYTQNLGRGTQEHGSAYGFGSVSNLGNSTASTNDDREGIIGPVIYVDVSADPDAIVLGEIDSLRQPGFCVKKMEGWTSVYVASPMLTTAILRNILRDAGVHLYSDTEDVIYPGHRYLMMHTRRGGEKTIRLPRAADIYDAWSNELLAQNRCEITQMLPARSTALYRLDYQGVPTN